MNDKLSKGRAVTNFFAYITAAGRQKNVALFRLGDKMCVAILDIDAHTHTHIRTGLFHFRVYANGNMGRFIEC